MPSAIEAEKAALRKAVKSVHFSAAERAESDRLLFARFLSLPRVEGCASLLLFYGVGDEPATAPLLDLLVRRGKAVSLPRCLPGGGMEARRYLGRARLRPNAFGIPEPDGACPAAAREELEVILVPNLCCDRAGYRLGRGGGYYDRYLAGFSGLTAALCRERLLQDALPAADHDVPVDLVLTEKRCLSFSRRGKSGASQPRSPCLGSAAAVVAATAAAASAAAAAPAAAPAAAAADQDDDEDDPAAAAAAPAPAIVTTAHRDSPR